MGLGPPEQPSFQMDIAFLCTLQSFRNSTQTRREEQINLGGENLHALEKAMCSPEEGKWHEEMGNSHPEGAVLTAPAGSAHPLIKSHFFSKRETLLRDFFFSLLHPFPALSFCHSSGMV